jgi:hypothetical protein
MRGSRAPRVSAEGRHGVDAPCAEAQPALGRRRALQPCTDARERRRAREAERRAGEDVELQRDLAREIAALFPACPPERLEEIARHTSERGSGRVGRTAAGRALDQEALTLAVVAAARHGDTDYDELLMAGVERGEARARVRAAVDATLERWRGAAVEPAAALDR